MDILAVGDIINVTMAATTNYQPAVGVEIIILNNFIDSQNVRWGFTDGVTPTHNYVTGGGGAGQFQNSTKMGITNTLYYENLAIAPDGGFSGIQIK